MKKYLILGLVIITVLSVSIVLAGKSDLRLVEVIPSGGQAIVAIPAHAVVVAPGVFSLGQAQDVDGRIVQGFLFIDNRKENAKPDNPGGGKGGGKGDGGKGSTCYAFLTKGAKWKTTEPYIIGNGVDLTLTETSLDAWDSKVSSFNIFGTGSSGFTDGADAEKPDGKNEVEFANLGQGQTIAYTIVWGMFNGPPSGRELVEWDTVFNTAYAFGDADVNGDSVMDYQNIATHEFGHAVGLGHPDDSCTEETMYRYADFGETNKRILEAGDIKGIQELYK